MATMSGWRITRAGIIFILVALLLVGVVIGASYLLRERGEQVRQQEAAEIARQNLEEASDEPVVIARDEPEQAEAGSGANTPGTTGEPVPTELPETGPSLSLLLGSVMVTAAFAAFWQSRRELARASIRS